MVKIPELAEDGQNWKIYHAKFLEVAATYDCFEVLAGRPYEGEDWDGCNALLCCTFMESVPPSIYFKIRCRTAHENFKYLAKRFHDNDPIPCTNEVQCAGTATAVETSEKSPTSADAATEQHADAKLDEDDLSTTKALTQGTEDVDNGNVRRIQDPRMSSEDSAKGTSAKCKEMTSVVLKSMLHEMQDQLQDSLQVTPYACEQEVVDGVVTAECTNGTAEMAKPTEIADIDRTALLGGELAERACGVDEGNGTECEGKSRLQETDLICEEADQHNANANANVPVAYGLPLEGEWTVYVSGKANDSEHDADTSNELTEPLTTTIELGDANGGGVPSMYLGGTRWHAGNTSCPEGQSDGLGCQTDGLNGQADGLRGSADALNVLNRAETEVIGHGEGTSMYLGPGDAKCLVLETDGTRNHTDTSNRSTDVPSVKTDVDISANKTVNIRKRQMSSTP